MKGWSETSLGDEIELAYGGSLPDRGRVPGPVPVFGSNGEVGTHKTALVRGPGIVVGRKGSVGAVAYSPVDFWPIDTTYYVLNRKGHDWRYLYHLLCSAGLEKLNSHSAVPGLNRENAYALRLSIPERPEQETIARVLDLVRHLVDLNANALETTIVLKQAVMKSVFTRGLRGEAQKETEIGLVPESWTVRALAQACEIRSGGTPRKSESKFWGGDIPWLSGKDLKRPSLNDAEDHITDLGLHAGSRLAPAGAVMLLVRGMGLAKDLPVATIERPMAFNQDIKALIPRGQLSGSFIRSAIYVGKERLLRRIVPSAHGTMTLNLDDVETFRIACPTNPKEADEIVAILNALDAKTDLHRRKRAVLDELFKALLHKLMTGEIRVTDLDLSAIAEAGVGQ
ncbi:MAG: restriction endonuclease subunit S [Gemmatimonadota bacterium]|nr:restriction endonuclease subunit S [Gemmatimonadota bacterium]